MMRDQRGMTLTELLASLTLMFVVLAAAFSVYLAIRGATQSGMERYMDKSAVDAVMNRLTAELSDATTVFVSADGGELRAFNGFAARAIVHDGARKRLILYDFSAGPGNIPFVKENATDASISRESHPALYANPRELPAAVSRIQLFDGPESDADREPIIGEAVGGGAAIWLSVTFEAGDGGEEEHVVETAVKLFDDAA